MTRHTVTFSTLLLRWLCWIGGMLMVTGASMRHPREKPNFIFMFVDDLGYGDVGFTGHPSSLSPNIDRMAAGGKVLTTWYTACPVCSGSRASLLTGRQYPRTGVPGSFFNDVPVGLPLQETTLAEMLKEQNYSTGMVGKWHLGQREVYLPGNRGFDHYLGVPFSIDEGFAKTGRCSNDDERKPPSIQEQEEVRKRIISEDFSLLSAYRSMGYLLEGSGFHQSNDTGSTKLPLVRHSAGNLTVLEQPLEYSTLSQKYNDFAVDFVKTNKDRPFFLYLAFSHVHVTAADQPERMFAGCAFKGKSTRGAFGDAVMEVDWIVGNVYSAVVESGIEDNTLIIFTSDNGPWMHENLQASGGSPGVFTARFAGYSNVGKGSTWEGGLRAPAFAYWKGQIRPFSRTGAVVSSLDVFPTFVALAGGELKQGVVYDGHDMSDILLEDSSKSHHEILFFYGGCLPPRQGPSAARYGQWKVYWCTGSGLGGSKNDYKFYPEWPLMFRIDHDPSEAWPVNPDGLMPEPQDAKDAISEIKKLHKNERKTFTYGRLHPEPDAPHEGPDQYCICCDRARDCHCNGPRVVDLHAHIAPVHKPIRPALLGRRGSSSK